MYINYNRIALYILKKKTISVEVDCLIFFYKGL